MGKNFRNQQGVNNTGAKIRQWINRWGRAILILMILVWGFQSPLRMDNLSVVNASTGATIVYLPFVMRGGTDSNTPVVHAPFINDSNEFNFTNQMAVFWFGKVNLTDNYTDVRTGYNRYLLVFDLTTIDHDLWYDASTSPSQNFSAWDSFSIYLRVPSTSGQSPTLYRLDASISQNKWIWSDRLQYQHAYKWTGSQWTPVDTMWLRTDHDYRGGYNGAGAGEGWNIFLRVRFLDLGLPEMPPTGTVLGMGIVVYDRDSASGPSIKKTWPENFQEMQEASYGKLTLGYPTFQPPVNPIAGRTTIVQNSATTVEDASVGGSTTCGNSGSNKWTEWGNRVYNSPNDYYTAVIQNQRSDVSDWPCFSRYYVTFPLNSIPSGKVILSAKLKMVHYGGSYLPEADPSNIQVMRIAQPWSPNTISWNNSPRAVENFPGTWVTPYDVGNSGAPGVEYTWDVTQALISAYNAGEPLRLALYSSDYERHSGKYFRSSEMASQGDVYPPKLTIEWGNP